MELNSGKSGFLDSYSGDTSKPWGLAVVCRWPEQTCHPQPQPSTPLCLLLCWAVRRRRNGGRWVCGWGKRCGAKSCLIAALHGLHPKLVPDLPARAACPSMAHVRGLAPQERWISPERPHRHQHTPWGKLSNSQTNSYH